MFGTHDPWLFAASLLIFNLTPGPDLLFTLTRTLQHGRRVGVAAAFGLAALLAASAEAFTVVRWVGAAYLLWLAIGLLRAPASVALDDAARAAPASTVDPWRVFRQGFLTNALNPKVAVFFLAFLPQFIDADTPHKTLAFLFLGAWFTVQGIVVLTLFVVAVAPLRRWQPSRAWRVSLRAGGAALFAGLAARLALAGRT